MNYVHIENNDHINLHTKKLIATLTLFCKILHNHLTNQTYQCPFIPKKINKNTFINLLDYIIIKDIPIKDINKPINTLNILIETEEISKLYSNHLNIYHSSSKQSKQCLFHTYYSNNHSNHDQKEQKQEDHILNCNFFLEIINNSPICANKLSIKHTKNTNKYTIQIIKPLIYNNTDLNGIELIFSDEIDIHTKEIDFIIAETLHLKSTNTSSINHNYDFLTFNDIINASLHCTDSIDYTFFFQISTSKNTMPMITNNSNEKLKFENNLSHVSNCSGMVYCSDYDENEMDDCDDYNYTDDMYLKALQFNNKMSLHRNIVCKQYKKDINICNHLSSPVLPIKESNNNLNINDDISIKSVVGYDSNKFYIPFKGYGLNFKSQSNMSVNSQLPCAGKIVTTDTEGSVFCFDD